MEPVFEDDMDGTGLSGSLTAGLSSGSLFPVGVTSVTYGYTDAAGNGPAVCTFTVTVDKGNYAPEVVAPLSSVSRSEGFGTVTVDLSPVFSDPDEDAMTYSAVSGNKDVVTVAVDGSELTITEVAPGLAEIVVTASDGLLEAEDQFEVTVIYVNKAPVALGTIPDQVMVDNVDSALIDLKPLFEDPEGEALTYTITMSEQGVVFYILDSTMLRLDPYKPGSTVVTVAASDPEGATTEISFGAQCRILCQAVGKLSDRHSGCDVAGSESLSESCG